MLFTPGQAVLVVSVYIINDDLPEDTELFSIELNSPRFGAEIGLHSVVTLNILSNDAGHGILEFAPVRTIGDINDCPAFYEHDRVVIIPPFECI